MTSRDPPAEPMTPTPPSFAPSSAQAPAPRAALRRLRQIWRSAGWPCQDPLEIELLAAGLIERVAAADPTLRPDTLRLTDAGVRVMAEAQARAGRALGAHDQLVQHTAQWLGAQGRLAWTGLSMFAIKADQERWGSCRPDVFSIRASSVETSLEPAVHEIKVSRADLLGELRNAAKRHAYLQISQRLWYVLGLDELGRPIADPSEIPDDCGVVQFDGEQLKVLRIAAPRPARALGLSTWLALARAQPAPVGIDAKQLEL